MRQSQDVLPATVQLQGCVEQLPRSNDRRHGQDQSRHDHMLVGPGIIVEGPLLGKVGQPHIAVAKVFDLGKARAESIRHDGRFAQQMVHGASSGLVVDFARRSGMHATSKPANHDHAFVSGCAPLVTDHGLEPVNACLGGANSRSSKEQAA